jgi:hypothetical protein
MSYRTARAQIVSLVKAAVPIIRPKGLPTSFVEAVEGGTDNPPAARSFTVFSVADDVRTPLKSRRRRVARLELRVFYPPMRDRATLDLVLRADYRVVGDALCDPSTWASSTSGIISIEQQGAPLIMHADVEEQPGRMVEHVYRFDLEYLSTDHAALEGAL